MVTDRISEHDIPRELFVRHDGAGPFAINDATAVEDCDPSFGAMVRLMQADAHRIRENRGGWAQAAYPCLFIALTHRLAHCLYLNRLRPLAVAVMWWCHAVTGTEIRPSAVIGPGLVVVHPSGIVISGGAIIGSGLELYGSNLLGSGLRHGRHGTPRLGDDVVMGHGGKAIGPVLIGDGAVVGAVALVLDDVPAGASVKGIPAR